MILCTRTGPHLAVDMHAPLAPDAGRMRLAVMVWYDATPARVEQWVTNADASGFAMTNDHIDPHPFARPVALHGLWIELHSADASIVRAHFTTSRAASLAPEIARTSTCQHPARKT